MPPAKKALNYLDFAVLSFIFFGYFSYISVLGTAAAPATAPISADSFDNHANWISIATELCLLAVAGGYLYWRKFDFSHLDFSVNKRTLPVCAGLMIAGALTTDLVLYGGYWLLPLQEALTGQAPNAENPPAQLFAHIGFSLVLFALVNGFFEELYFMGLAFAVKKEHRVYALATGIVIRFIFHVYQGLLPAFAIAVVGVVFILFRQKINSLTPFILAHAVFDIFGAGILSFLFFL